MKLDIEPCSEYPLHELDIQDWLAKEKGYDTQSTGTIKILCETSDAYQIGIVMGTPENYGNIYYDYLHQWLPKSQCKIVERTEPKK